jgi:hypothetical protein
MTVPTGVWRAGAVVRSHKPSAGMPSRYPESSRLSPSITYRPILGIPAARLVSGRRLEGLAIPGGAARGTGYRWGSGSRDWLSLGEETRSCTPRR